MHGTTSTGIFATNKPDEEYDTNTNHNRKRKDNLAGQSPTDRRTAIINAFFQTVALSGAALASSPSPSEAACLSGDTDVTCIGVYKLPLDDAVNSYIDTPEHLAKFAPDLRYVPLTEYPPNYQSARGELVEMQEKLKNTIALVTKGNLTGAGVDILAIVPRTTVAGRVVVQTLQNHGEMSMKAMRCENAHLEILYSLGSCDIMIGMALAGRMGAITVAQIQILEDMRDAEQQFKELLRAMPEDLNG